MPLLSLNLIYNKTTGEREKVELNKSIPKQPLRLVHYNVAFTDDDATAGCASSGGVAAAPQASRAADPVPAADNDGRPVIRRPLWRPLRRPLWRAWWHDGRHGGCLHDGQDVRL